uniref:Uncharacterized protein n=1 Tax=viral metagenome TaxID=1070528 RepID=A0A6M3L7U6_9ZZZZ
MIPIQQTICNFQTGNCMQACVASIFELPLEKVPNFMMGGTDHYGTHLQKWCDQFGIVALDISFKDESAESLIRDCYVIAVGKSPRIDDKNEDYPENYKKKYKDAKHGVVWYNGKMVKWFTIHTLKEKASLVNRICLRFSL